MPRPRIHPDGEDRRARSREALKARGGKLVQVALDREALDGLEAIRERLDCSATEAVTQAIAALVSDIEKSKAAVAALDWAPMPVVHRLAEPNVFVVLTGEGFMTTIAEARDPFGKVIHGQTFLDPTKKTCRKRLQKLVDDGYVLVSGTLEALQKLK